MVDSEGGGTRPSIRMTEASNHPIFIFTGPTGGHFFPAKEVAEVCHSNHPESQVHLFVNRVPTFVDVREISKRFCFHVIPFSPLQSRSLLHSVFLLCKCMVAFFRTLVLFLKFRPRLVLGFGSYGSVVGVWIASILKVPIFLHEQNVVPGRANRFLTGFARKVALSFPNVGDMDKGEKFVYSGYPLRKSFWNQETASSEDGKGSSLFGILIFGGSQGAQKLNEMVLNCFEGMSPEERSFFAVTHITGNNRAKAIEERYRTLGVRSAVYGFTDRMSEHLKQSRLVIARAGAGTIFELAAVGRAAILVPYPHAYGHQKLNAKYLALRGASWVVEENHLSGAYMRELVLRMYREDRIRGEMERKIRTLDQDNAAENIADVAWTLMGG